MVTGWRWRLARREPMSALNAVNGGLLSPGQCPLRPPRPGQSTSPARRSRSARKVLHTLPAPARDRLHGDARRGAQPVTQPTPSSDRSPRAARNYVLARLRQPQPLQVGNEIPTVPQISPRPVENHADGGSCGRAALQRRPRRSVALTRRGGDEPQVGAPAACRPGARHLARLPRSRHRSGPGRPEWQRRPPAADLGQEGARQRVRRSSGLANGPGVRVVGRYLRTEPSPAEHELTSVDFPAPVIPLTTMRQRQSVVVVRQSENISNLRYPSGSICLMRLPHVQPRCHCGTSEIESRRGAESHQSAGHRGAERDSGLMICGRRPWRREREIWCVV